MSSRPSQRRVEGYCLIFRGTMKQYYVYMLTNKSDTLYYTGVTNDIVRRAWEHKNKLNEGYTKKYNLNKLVYYEIYEDINEAIEREKKLKKWNREKKKLLVGQFNIRNEDLWERIIK